MTAEQLEELLAALNKDEGQRHEALHRLRKIAPSLARRVIAAERMREAFEKRLFGADNAAECHMSIIAYREASK